MPVNGESRFERSVIYLCRIHPKAPWHYRQPPGGQHRLSRCWCNSTIIEKADQIKLPEKAETMKVLKGGPVETGRGFVLLRAIFISRMPTLKIGDGIWSDRNRRYSQSDREGRWAQARHPGAWLAGWAPGQLEPKSRIMAGYIAMPIRI